MTPATATAAFWVDHEHDLQAASDGRSRYGFYVRDRIPGGFAETWDGTFASRLPERFAALAWHTATGPVMAPPYVAWRSPVLSARLGLDGDGDSTCLITTVDIASPWPQPFGGGDAGGQPWRPWPREHSWHDGNGYLREPDGDEVTNGGYYALASLRLVFPVPAELLPATPSWPARPGMVKDTARRAVSALVAELNRVVYPVLASLERS